YDGTTGAFIKNFANADLLNGPIGLAFDPNGPFSGDLFVSSLTNDEILAYNGNGDPDQILNLTVSGFLSPTFLTFSPSVPAGPDPPDPAVPEPSSLLLAALGALTTLASAGRKRAAGLFRSSKA